MREQLLPDVRSPLFRLAFARVASAGLTRLCPPRRRRLIQWDETALRIKASRLMGSQSLARYPSWKGDRAAVDAEQARNRALGEQTGCWKSGVLVEDDNGSVAKAISVRDGSTTAPAADAAGGKATGKRKAP